MLTDEERPQPRLPDSEGGRGFPPEAAAGRLRACGGNCSYENLRQAYLERTSSSNNSGPLGAEEGGDSLAHGNGLYSGGSNGGGEPPCSTTPPPPPPPRTSLDQPPLPPGPSAAPTLTSTSSSSAQTWSTGGSYHQSSAADQWHSHPSMLQRRNSLQASNSSGNLHSDHHSGEGVQLWKRPPTPPGPGGSMPDLTQAGVPPVQPQSDYYHEGTPAAQTDYGRAPSPYHESGAAVSPTQHSAAAAAAVAAQVAAAHLHAAAVQQHHAYESSRPPLAPVTPARSPKTLPVSLSLSLLSLSLLLSLPRSDFFLLFAKASEKMWL